jgi:hypothetical protein
MIFPTINNKKQHSFIARNFLSEKYDSLMKSNQIKKEEYMRPESISENQTYNFTQINPLITPPVKSTETTFGSLGELLLSATETNVSKKVLKKTVPYSNYDRPIEERAERAERGYSRNWGDASSATQTSVMQTILTSSKDLSKEDQAILLGIARIESGFNPDAAATTTSASGVFQIIRSTGENLGISQKNIFSMKDNIKSGVKLFKENIRLVDKKYPQLTGNERAVMLYALHHDGPSLKYGGAGIAREKLSPYLDRFRAITSEASSNSTIR